MFSLSLTAFAAFVSDGVSTRPGFLQKYDPCIRLCPHTDGRVGSTYNCMYRDGMGQTISTTAPLCNVGAAGSDRTGTLGRHMAVFQYLQGGRIGHIHLTALEAMR
jgi:hypothetical protein